MKKIFLLTIFLYLFYGCGYTTRGFQYQEDKIFIAPIINKIDITSEERRYSGYKVFPILLEKKLTNELINKFNIDGHLKVVSETEESLVLSCFIKDYQKEALKYTSDEEVKEQRLRLYVHIKLQDSEGSILKEKDIVGEASYFLSGPNKKSEESAQSDLIDDTARRILEAVIEEW
jgi:uncharacterized protein YcfL